MKKLVLILPLIASGYLSAQDGAAAPVAKDKLLYNLTVRIPMTSFFFTNIGVDEWKSVNPDYTNLSIDDPSWKSYSPGGSLMNRGRMGGTGIMVGLNFSPVNKRGKTRLVYGVEAGYLTSQGFNTIQSKSFREVIDTISFSSGLPDQYRVKDSTLIVEYAYSASRIVLSPRIGVYFNQLKRFGFGVGVNASVGMSVGGRLTKTDSESINVSTVDDPSQSSPTAYNAAGLYESRYKSVSNSQSAKSSVNFSGGTFAEVSYQLGKEGKKLSHYKIGLEIQAGMVRTNIAKQIKRTTPYYSTALTFAYAF